MFKPNPPPRIALPSRPGRARGVYWRPSPAFLEELCAFLKGKRVLEVFAGNGFLAAWLAAAGIDIRATTRFSGHDAHEYGIYFPVEELEASEAVGCYGAESDVLLFCWPTATREVLKAARRWGATKDIVFIGEWTDYSQNHLAGCACDEFFASVDKQHHFASYVGNVMEAAYVCRLRPQMAYA